MFEYMLTKEQIKIRDEVREFVRGIPRQMILDMDTDTIKFPKEFLREAAQRNLMGCRYPKKWGGRDMDWVTTCMIMESVGTAAMTIGAARPALEIATNYTSRRKAFGQVI